MNGLQRHLAALALALATPLAAPSFAGERIVAAGGAVTEILWDLGAASEVVGVDTTSRVPAEALASRPDVGYFRRLSAEGLLSLNPTLMITANGAGPREVLDLVAGAGVRIVPLDDAWSARGVVANIERIGAAIGREARARALADRVAAEFAALDAARAVATERPRVLFVLSLANGRPLVAGHATAADAMIGLAGGVNVAGDFAGYKPLTDEAIVTAAPDVVVVMENGPESLSADRVFALPALAASPAARDRRLVAVDGTDLAFGPRTPAVARVLMARFRR